MSSATESLPAPPNQTAKPLVPAQAHDDYIVVRDEDQSHWEAQLLRHPCRNIYTGWGWGEYKSRLGWTVERLLVRNRSGGWLGMAQVQKRTRFGVRHVYIHGGPLFFATDDTVVERTLATLLDYLDPGHFGFVVINFERFHTPSALLAVLACQFSPALNHAQHTIVLDTSIGPDEIRKRLRRLWSRQLGRALANPDLSVHIVEDHDERVEAFDAFARMYTELAERKGFDMAISPKVFRDIAVGDSRYIFLVVRYRNEIVSVRIAHCGADRLIDYVNGSSSQAMAVNANTLAVWRLVQHTIESGLRYYDFCGIDPVANPGVFRFKRGIGGIAVQSGPLWVHSRNAVVRAAIQTVLTIR